CARWVVVSAITAVVNPFDYW
nr:immunoglobulin heavy chain junction region [Macaca mulatta]